jgi:AraC-like DNA-binding protein
VERRNFLIPIPQNLRKLSSMSPSSVSRVPAPTASGVVPQPAIVRRLISSANVDEVFASMPQLQIEHQVLSRPQGISRSGSMLLPGMALTSNMINARSRATGGVPRGHMVLAVDIAGVPGRQFGGTLLQPDDALIGYDGAEFDYLNSAGFCGVSMVVPGTQIEAAVESRFGAGFTLAQYHHVQTWQLDNRKSSLHWQLFKSMANLLHQNTLSLSAASAMFAGADITDVIASIVGAHLRQGADQGKRLWVHRRPVARRAEEFMHAHLHEPITLHQICKAARASERTVEYAFNELYAMGAKKFLRVLRLNRAQRLLRSPEAKFIAVQDIAHSCGFWHMGHFSTNYRRLFGEAPTQTQQRR